LAGIRLALSIGDEFTNPSRSIVMGSLLSWAIIALIVSLVAGALGFTGLAVGAAVVAKFIFGIFLFIALVLFVLFLLGIGVASSI
jgi:uncharacterized membrane protein YtjA (UPF0391 family)